MDVIWKGSRHFTKGRRGYRPEAVVVHIMEGTLVGTDDWFNDPASKVSAHYGIGRGGEVHQYVREADQAWHAGRSWTPTWSEYRDGVNPNLYTIGIEHEGKPDDAWPAAMYEASAALIKEICLRWNIAIDRQHIVGHREIYARKSCPGSQVDLSGLTKMASGLAVDLGNHNLIEQKGKVTVRATVNLRRAPTIASPKVGSIAGGTVAAYTGWTSSGQAVDGNPHWYRRADGRYFWAGATEQPVPGL